MTFVLSVANAGEVKSLNAEGLKVFLRPESGGIPLRFEQKERKETKGGIAKLGWLHRCQKILQAMKFWGANRMWSNIQGLEVRKTES